MKRFLVIFFLLLVAAPLYAQGNSNHSANANHVYLLVVDDFGDHFSALSNQLRSNPSVLNRLRTEEQHLPPSRGRGRQGTPTPAPQTPTPAPTLTAIPSTLDTDLRAQARQVVTSSVQGNIDQENCTVIPEGQSFFATGGASFFATGGASFFATGGAGATTPTPVLPHGVRVVTELQQLLKKYGNQNQIDIVPVDTNGFTTSVISDRVTQTITRLSAQHPNANFVVNMSFAVVPCAALADLAVYDALMHQTDADLAGNLDAMQAVFTQLMASGVFSQKLTSNDALQGFVNTKCNNGHRSVCASGSNPVIMVAAAGNSSAMYPFYPAAWNGIESVSASDDEADFVSTGSLASYSNYGAVMMPGVWAQNLGTSFAAPRYSFAMALYLLNDQPETTCSAFMPAAPVDWLNSPPTTPNQTLC